MAFPLERLLSWRYLRSPRQEGFVAVIAGFSFFGILLGVATLIIITGVMNGFRHELLERILGFNGHLTIQARAQDFDLKAVSSHPDVALMTPMLEKQALCMASKATSGMVVRGLLPQDLQKRLLISDNMQTGSIEALTQPNTIIIGAKLARKLGVQTNDTLKILLPDMKETALGAIPRTRHFKIVGIFESGMQEYDAGFSFMSLKNLQDFTEDKEIKTFEVFLKDPHLSDRVKNELAVPYGSIFDWKYANSYFFKAIEVQSHVMFFILSLIVLVAVFNIISCLVMLVKEKTKDIAILRTLGMTSGSIMRTFMFIGGTIGVAGTTFGTMVGLLVGYNIDRLRVWLEALSRKDLFQAEIYFLSHLPCRVDLKDVLKVMTVSLILSFLATLYPAWKAARLHPIQGLRYE